MVHRDDERTAGGDGSGESLDRYLDAIEDVFFAVGPNGELWYWNDSLPAVTGYDDEALVGRDARSLFEGEDRERIIEGIAAVVETGSAEVVADLVAKDGSKTPYEFRGRLLDGRDGSPAVVGIGRDVSERRRRERMLTALHDVATDLADCETVDAVVERTIDASDELLAFDLSVINLEEDGLLTVADTSEGLPPDGVTPMTVDEGIAGLSYREREPLHVDDLRDWEEANPQGPYRSALSIPLGEHGVFQTVAEEPAAFDEADLELAELLASHAASALARLEYERELERQNDHLEQFASMVSHDLRNPLNVATGHLEEARRRYPDDESLAAVATSLDRMETLVEDLLALARVGDRPADPSVVALEDAAAGCWTNVATGDASLSVDADLAFEADEGALAQLLENLLRNAVEHGGDDVSIEVGEVDDGTGFYVADDGPGVPPDERDQVFDDGYSTNAKGTGFGLAIVREVADAHGWSVRVTESDADGARFEVRGVGTAD